MTMALQDNTHRSPAVQVQEPHLHSLWLVFTLAILVLAGVIGHNIYHEHGTLDADARAELATQVKVVDENLSLRLITTNSALNAIRNELPWVLTQPNGNRLAIGRLQSMASAMIGVRTFVLMNSDGKVIASNSQELMGNSFRDGERFQAIRQGGDPAQLYVSAPFKTPLGIYSISVGKVVLNQQGQFGGVILAIIDPEFFRTLLNSVRYTQDMRSSVAHGDGKVIFSTQDSPNITGRDLSLKADSFFNQHMKSGRALSVFSGIAFSSDDERLLGVGSIRPHAIAMDKPLVLAISRSVPALYAPWRQQAWVKVGLFGLLVLVGTLGMLFYQRRRWAYVHLLAVRQAENQQSADALQAKEVQFRTLIDTMTEGFCLLDIVFDEHGQPCDVCHILANPAYERQTGQRLSDIIGHTALELHPGIEPHWMAQFSKVAMTGEPTHFQAQFGSLGRWFDVNAYQMGRGRLALMLYDITEHKQMVERLRQQAMIFNSTEEGIIITDGRGCVIEANPAFERITEYSLDELRGQNMNIIQSGRQDRSFYQTMWRALTEAGKWQGEIWNRRKSGDIYLEWITISAVRDEDGEVVNYVGTSIDISRMNHAQTELERLAHHDALTDLPNRLLLVSRLEHAMERVKRDDGLGAVLFIDIDRFKQVNDTLGHKAGDELLQAVAGRIKDRLRDVDTLARLGGDEFVILLEEISDEQAAATVAQEVINQLGCPFTLSCGNTAHIGGSVGIALFTQDGSSAIQLIERADQALYAAKNSGRGAYRFFSANEVSSE